MTQLLANPITTKKPVKRFVFRALVVPANWTMNAAVKLLKSEGTAKNPCRYILINNKYFVFGSDELDRENGHPMICMVPPEELINEWNRARFPENT